MVEIYILTKFILRVKIQIYFFSFLIGRMGRMEMDPVHAILQEEHVFTSQPRVTQV